MYHREHSCSGASFIVCPGRQGPRNSMGHIALETGAARARTLRSVAGRCYYKMSAAFGAVRDRFYSVPGRMFDLRHGVDTCGMVQIPDLVIPEEARLQAGRYQATKVSVFKRIIQRLPADRSRFAFVDFGCGKGRCLLLAARAGFERVIGIELSKPLAEVARENLSAFEKGRYASKISVDCVHSTAASLPDQPSVYYFYNPFGRDAMSETLHSIAAHLDRTGHEAYAIYVNPMHGNVIAEGGFALLEGGREQSEDWAVWHRPAAEPAMKSSARAA
jgi:SAM-dependent methyltransferase